MPDYRHIIRQAYQEILGRPADDAGLEHYNALMNVGQIAEVGVREAMRLSPEYASTFPDSPPPPQPGTMSPLRVVGGQFANDQGDVKLLGYIICCCSEGNCDTPDDEALTMGWPFISTAALDEIAAHKLNYTDLRLGPSINRERWGQGEKVLYCGYFETADGRYDLTRWNDACWLELRRLLAYAESKGIYVGISIIDSWILDHDASPWNPSRNIQGYSGGTLEVVKHAPSDVHRRWIEKVVSETARFNNVIYLDGNESFKGRPSQEWIHGIRDIAREKMEVIGARHLFGSNSGITEEVDYLVTHSDGIPDPHPTLPTVNTEYDNQSPDNVISRARQARLLGPTAVSYHYWAGGHTMDERAHVLDELQKIVEGTGAAVPIECPYLVRMGIKVHGVFRNHQVVEDRTPQPGDMVDIDLTPRFDWNQGADRGRPCNDEHHEVCASLEDPNVWRPCEDPRGGVYSLVSAPAETHTKVEGFHFVVGPLPAHGSYTVRCEAPPEYRDGLGQRVRVGGSTARQLTFITGVPA